MVRRLAMAAVAATAFSIALTGCGGSSNSGSGTGGSSAGNSSTSGGGGTGGDAVAWSEKVCKSVVDDMAKLSETPDIDTSDPAKAMPAW